MKTSEKMKKARKFGSRFGGLGLVLLAPASVIAPGCKFESCADTNSCEPKEGDDSLGGQGGEIEDPEKKPDGTGGDEMESGMGGDGAGGNGTGASGTGASTNGTGGDEPALECDDGELACEGECIDPSSDVEYCGAGGACEGDEAGELCEEGEICVDGGCELDCPESEVACDGSCVDPLTSDDYCGADSACEDFSACSAREQCIAGGCAGWGEAGTANFGTGTSSYFQIGQPTIDGEGEVFFAWARPAGATPADVQTSQLVVDAMLWSQSEVRDSEAAAASDVQMETNSAGRTVLVWRQEPDPGEVTVASTIWSAVRDPGSNWGDAVPISGPLAGGASEVPTHSPHLTLDEEGNAYVVWGEDYTLNRVVNSLKAGETTWGTPAILAIDAPKPWDIRNVNLESLADGEALLMIENGAPGDFTWYSAVSVDGEFGSAEPALDATQEGSSLSASLASNEEVAVLFWAASTSSGTALDFAPVTIYRDSVWSEPTLLRTPGTVVPIRETKVAIDEAGNITTAWISGRDTDALWSAELKAGEDEWIYQEAPVAVGIEGQGMRELVLEIDGLGNVQLAWIQKAGTADSVWAARRRTGNSDFDVPRVVEEWETEPATGLSMDFNDAGQGVITWWTVEPTERTLGFNYFR